MDIRHMFSRPREGGSMTIRGHDITFLRCSDYMMGEIRQFWRADRGMETIATMCETKSKCISEARTFLRLEAEQQKKEEHH